MRESVW